MNSELEVGMKHKILVIEDDEPLCFLLGRILKEKFEVSIHSEPLSAMNWLSRGNLPNLILCDFDLPGINGLDFIKNMKRSGSYNQIPLIMLSGMSDPKIKEKSMAAGANSFLLKPFDPTGLIETISNELKKVEIYV
jgi:two-component system, chemotaxis family, chemotaxis protein CheY